MPQAIQRTPERQAEIDHEVEALALYHFERCPFCVRVRQQIERLALPIEKRDIQRDPAHRDALMAGGGRTMVPCLRIDHGDRGAEWMYESADINRYLETRFGS
ncbi:glutaredoxin family protein [Salinicola aestuarinus]|uniref:glutaredoxin family protein n=1 Tax=Salinicola aestuarinus TaxID=1949082 RepID=UPI000DA1A9D5|nr:glutaredoxin [Salinicola aestuarinus]